MNITQWTDAELEQFDHDGYLFKRGLFDTEEMDLLLRIARTDKHIRDTNLLKTDAAGRASRLNIQLDVRDDIYSAFVADPRIAVPMRQILGGEVYHWHHKMMLKEPRVGGAWEWHQDYGYWYADNFLLPLLASCMIAVDRAYRGNGCLQVLRGSHKMGRIDHGQGVGGQAGADPKRIEAAMARFELVYCEMEPGTALFFDCNTLHCSAPNTSPDARWSLICCYNAMRNLPFVEAGHRKPAAIVPGSIDRIKQAGRNQLRSLHELSESAEQLTAKTSN